MQSTPPTPAEADPEQMLDLDLATTKARLIEDDGRIVIALADNYGVAYLSVRANADAESAVRRLRLALERLESEVKRRTVGYRATPGPTSTPVGTPWLHGPLTGPVVAFPPSGAE